MRNLIFKCIITEGVGDNDSFLFKKAQPKSFLPIKVSKTENFDTILALELRKNFSKGFIIAKTFDVIDFENETFVYVFVVPDEKIQNNSRTPDISDEYEWIKLNDLNKKDFISPDDFILEKLKFYFSTIK